MKTVLGFLFIGLGIFLEVMWLGFCFGSVVIGILLLIFAPAILFLPFNFFLAIGLGIINKDKYSQKNYSYRYYQHTNSNTNNNSYARATSSLDKHYETLESSPSDSMDIIKKNYRRLIKEYHYDSIASKNLPKEMQKFAEEKTKSLNEAYSAIKSAKI